jgi:hypothetical protein
MLGAVRNGVKRGGSSESLGPLSLPTISVNAAVDFSAAPKEIHIYICLDNRGRAIMAALDVKPTVHHDRSRQCGEQGYRHRDHPDSKEVPETHVELFPS